MLQPLLFILPIVFVAYYPVLKNQFTNWDDPDLILENPLIRNLSFSSIKTIFTSFYFGNYQPLHLLSYAIEYHYWALNPAGYHAVSLFLFLCTSSLVYYFIYLVSGKNRMIAIMGTLLFAINAMHVESVAWAAERKDTLYSLFYMASLIAYVKYIGSMKGTSTGAKVRYFSYAFLLFVIALFSKVMAVSIVGAMVMLDYFYARRLRIILVLEKIPFVMLSVTVGIIQVKATASTGSIDKSNQFDFADRILIVCRNLMFYFYKLIAPVNLSAFYPYPERRAGTPWPAEFYIAPVFLLLLLVLLIWGFRKSRLVVFCLGFFVSALALVLQYVAIGPAMFNERYSLIPSVAFSLALASGIWWLVTRYPNLKNVFYGATGLYLVLMFILTFARCGVWQTSLTLWDDALKQFPRASIPLNNRGKYYGKDLANTTRGIVDLSDCIRYNPAYPNAYSNRGIIYAVNNKFDSAIADFTYAINLKGDFYEPLANRAIAYAQTNRPAMAIGDFNKCIDLEPHKAEGYLNRGYCFIQMNEPGKALEDFNKGLKLDPSNAEFYVRRSRALFYLGRYEEAYNDVMTARSAGARIDDGYFDQIKRAAGK